MTKHHYRNKILTPRWSGKASRSRPLAATESLFVATALQSLSKNLRDRSASARTVLPPTNLSNRTRFPPTMSSPMLLQRSLIDRMKTVPSLRRRKHVPRRRETWKMSRKTRRCNWRTARNAKTCKRRQQKPQDLDRSPQVTSNNGSKCILSSRNFIARKTIAGCL